MCFSYSIHTTRKDLVDRYEVNIAEDLSNNFFDSNVEVYWAFTEWHWTYKTTGEIVPTFTIITTEANELMSYIHNNKKRMPVILDFKHEREWLDKGALTLMNESLKARRY